MKSIYNSGKEKPSILLDVLVDYYIFSDNFSPKRLTPARAMLRWTRTKGKNRGYRYTLCDLSSYQRANPSGRSFRLTDWLLNCSRYFLGDFFQHLDILPGELAQVVVAAPQLPAEQNALRVINPFKYSYLDELFSCYNLLTRILRARFRSSILKKQIDFKRAVPEKASVYGKPIVI